MTWAKVDDHANEHRKQLAAGAEACWLWACGLMYANRQKARDGFIPELTVGMLYPFKNAKALATKLVDVGLWKRVTGGYEIHDFLYWNQSKEQREDTLEKGRQRAAKSYEKKRRRASDSSPESSESLRPKNSDSSGSTPTPTPTPGDLETPPKDLTGRPEKPAHSGVVVDETPELQRIYRLWDRNPGAFVLEDGHKRPEFQAVWFAWCRPFGITEGPVITQRLDQDILTIIAAFAAGRTLEQLLAAGKAAESSEFMAKLRAERKGGPSVFSAKVLRQLLADAGPGTDTPEIDAKRQAHAAERRQLEAQREREAIARQTEEARARLAASGVDPDADLQDFDLGTLTAGIG